MKIKTLVQFLNVFCYTINLFNMKKLILSTIVASTILTSCSTVSTIMQNTFPYNSSVVITSGSPANTTLSAIGSGTNINQITGISNNVKDIKIANANMSVTSGSQGMGVFKSVKVYLSSGSNEILVASRDNISDNIGSSLSLDVSSNQVLDQLIKSGNSVQQKIVYVLKSSPSADFTVKTSMNFSSVPVK